MIRVDDTEGDGLSFFNLAQSKGQRFFRLEEKLVYGHRGTDSDQPAFYERQYLNSWNPDLTLSQFAANHSNAEVLNGISWDPTTACYFEEFNTTPEEHNADLEPDDLERRIYDFTLNKNETALFQQNGFVVSPRVRAFLPLQDGTPAGHLKSRPPVSISTTPCGLTTSLFSSPPIPFSMPGTKLLPPCWRSSMKLRSIL